MVLSVAFALLTFFVVQPALGQESVCPSSNQGAMKEVQSFLNDSDDSELRQELGISAAPDQVRTLTDSQDADVCRRIKNDFQGDSNDDLHFYKAGSYYFVVYRKKSPTRGDGTVDYSPSPFIILDRDLQLQKILI